jgi:hypothetical protein
MEVSAYTGLHASLRHFEQHPIASLVDFNQHDAVIRDAFLFEQCEKCP